MNYRRRHNRKQKREARFRGSGYETAKQGATKILDKLGEWTGAVLGMAAGSAAARYGLPISPTAASLGGMVAGMATAVLAQGHVLSAVDRLRERREKRTAAGGTGQGSASSRRGPRAVRHRRYASGSGHRREVNTGAVIGDIEGVIAELDRAEREVLGLVDHLRNTQGWVLILLTGSRSDLLQEVNGRMNAIGKALIDGCELLRLSKDDLRGYLRHL